MTEETPDHKPTPTPASPRELSTTASEEKTWASAAHLSSLIWLLGIPGFVGPLVVWLIKKDELPFVADQAKEALNFQISVFIYGIGCVILIFTIIGAVVGIPALIALGIAEIIFTIIATVQAGEGLLYRYPATIRLLN